MDKYCIVGNFCWFKFSYTRPKSIQNQFCMFPHASATRPRSYSSPMVYSIAWWSCSRFMSFLASFYFDCTTDQESLGRPRKDLVKHYLIFTACSEVKAHTNFSIVKIFAVFIFACEICEISTMQKFPAIWYMKMELIIKMYPNMSARDS